MSKSRDIADSAATINALDGVTTTPTELNYVSGVTSAIQTQIDSISAGFSSMQVFTTSGTWTKPAGVTKIKVTGVGGGGSGGGGQTSTTSAAGGGGAGGYFVKVIDVSAISSETVTIGSGGAAPLVDVAGNSGTATSFGAHASGNGGSGGVQAGSGGAGGAGGTTTGGDYGITGARGGGGSGDTKKIPGGGGASPFGGQGEPHYGGASPDASGYGSGGSGGYGGYGGGAGAGGIIIVEEFA